MQARRVQIDLAEPRHGQGVCKIAALSGQPPVVLDAEQHMCRFWFASVETFAKVLSQCNRRLLALIAEEKPNSITELAALAGQSRSRISRALMTMTQYGLVEFRLGEQGRLIPQVAYDQVRLEVSLTSAP